MPFPGFPGRTFRGIFCCPQNVPVVVMVGAPLAKYVRKMLMAPLPLIIAPAPDQLSIILAQVPRKMMFSALPPSCQRELLTRSTKPVLSTSTARPPTWEDCIPRSEFVMEIPLLLPEKVAAASAEGRRPDLYRNSGRTTLMVIAASLEVEHPHIRARNATKQMERTAVQLYRTLADACKVTAVNIVLKRLRISN